MTKLKKVPAAIWLFLVAATYYGILCAKQYTWVFISGDSGDWLACANWWMVPQPYGSPLYIILCRLVGFLPGSQPLNLTILLSVIPAAITVTLVYLIVNRLVNNRGIATASSLVLLGSAIFLSQSTVLEQYVIAAMFLTLATYAYIRGYKLRTAIFLGLGTAVHVFIGTLVIAWIIVEWKEWKQWLKPAVVLVTITIASYSFILVLMAQDTPRLLAGGLNVDSVKWYWTVTTGAILGQLSLYEAPVRLFTLGRLLLTSFGLALIPIALSWRRPITKYIVLLSGIALITLWYYGTNLDPAAWTFITFASPAFAILCGLGLSKVTKYYKYVVAAGAIALILANGVFLNANTLANENPMAATYRQELQDLPDSSIVLATPGAYSMGLFYAMSEGKNLIPLIYHYLDDWEFADYQSWLRDKHSLDVDSTLGAINKALTENIPIYFAGSPNFTYPIEVALVLEPTSGYLVYGEYDTYIRKVVGLTGVLPEPEFRITK